MKVKEESEKAGLKLSIQKIKIMAPCPNTSWQIDWKTKETVTNFIVLGSKITADSDCSHKAMINLESVLKKQKHHFTNKGQYSQSYGLSSSHVQLWEPDHKED